MRPRSELHTILLEITTNVYFQPPTNIEMKYPCIVYNRDKVNTDFSDNLPYNRFKRYSLTVIDRNPDSGIPDKIGELPMCVHDRSFRAENLNHDTFTIFF